MIIHDTDVKLRQLGPLTFHCFLLFLYQLSYWRSCGLLVNVFKYKKHVLRFSTGYTFSILCYESLYCVICLSHCSFDVVDCRRWLWCTRKYLLEKTIAHTIKRCQPNYRVSMDVKLLWAAHEVMLFWREWICCHVARACCKSYWPIIHYICM